MAPGLVEADLTTGASLVSLTAVPSDTSLQLLQPFCRIYPAATRRLDELGATGGRVGGAPTTAPRRGFEQTHG